MSDHSIVIGLGFGDEGKGRTVQRLVKENDASYVIRFSGGGQAAHNVVTQDGKHHTFSHFGSASFERIPTILSRFMMVDPFTLAREGDALTQKVDWNPFSLLHVSVNSPLVTPLHVLGNHALEAARGDEQHGSCGLGLGETMRYSIDTPFNTPVMGDLRTPAVLKRKLEALAEWYAVQNGVSVDMYTPIIETAMAGYAKLMEDRLFNFMQDEHLSSILRSGYGVFEGSQGVLLDERFGFHPHTTWSDVTPGNAQLLLGEAGLTSGEVVGVTRTYHTRHGAGPFPSEYKGTEEDESERFPELHNGTNPHQGGWRVGRLDVPLLTYAVKMIGGIDRLSVTHLDYPVTDAVTSYTDDSLSLEDNYFRGDYDKQEQFTEKLKRTGVNVTPVKDVMSVIEEAAGVSATYLSDSPVG